MPKIDLHTVLGFQPRPKKHEIIFITRGATASLNFNLTQKVYRISNIDQLTYSFKQGKNLFSYNMIDYFRLTQDIYVQADKAYYIKIESNESISLVKFERAFPEFGELIPENTYYELYEPQFNEEEENWQINAHFEYIETDSFAFVNFIFSPLETKLFKPTEPDNNVCCEVAIRLNTNEFEGLHNTDSIIIEPQHPIAVVDSLYSHK